jgi:uncharacterized protein
VWDLFAYVAEKAGTIPTLIEWDANVPDWATLKAEAERAEKILVGVRAADPAGSRDPMTLDRLMEPLGR